MVVVAAAVVTLPAIVAVSHKASLRGLMAQREITSFNEHHPPRHYHCKTSRGDSHSQRVHVGIWYILSTQRGSHIPTLRPKYIPYTYMDPLGFIGSAVGSRAALQQEGPFAGIRMRSIVLGVSNGHLL